MKNYILAIFIASLLGCASVIPNIEPVTGEVASLIVEREDESKDNLYIKANSWAVDTFVSAESVIEFQDKEAGVIKGKYLIEIVNGIYYLDIKTTITIQAKDNRCRILLTDPLMRFTGDVLNGTYRYSKPYNPINTQAVLDQSKSHWDKLIISFKQAMEKEIPSW
ncbi:MAG: DUF4468 domain-containing protein [Planctomycetes bacterium]|nr:DUF4468 domain-containing protein [Planctomycetota bacterium]